MDVQAGDVITFCGCLGTQLQQRGNDTWVVKGDDVKAVVRGVSAEDLTIDYDLAVINVSTDPLA